MELIIDKTQFNIMKEWLEEHYPHEACGFFSGKDDEDQRTVDDLWSVDNISTENLRRRFVIDPMDYMKAEQKVMQNGSDLLGLFHSHPDHPAFPSRHDLAAAQPFFSYIIASVKDGKLDEVRSFRLENGDFAEETVTIVDNG